LHLPFLPVPSCISSHFAHAADDKQKDVDNDDDDDDDNKENILGNNCKKPAAKRGRVLTMVTTTVESNNESMGFRRKQPWMPNYALAMWKEDNLRKRVTICIAFDAGVNLNNGITYIVLDDGFLNLEIKCKGIQRLGDVDTLHEYHRQQDKHSLPKFKDKFFQVLKLFEADTTYNKATISLPFPVQATFLEELRLEDLYKPLTIYLEMVAVEENNWSDKKKAKLVSMKADAMA
jgi:hypothetical protein